MNREDALKPIVEMLDEQVKVSLSKLSPKDITKSIVEDFMSARAKVIYQLMGLEYGHGSGGGWKIDHCNGRGGNSPLGDYLKKACEAELLPEITRLTREYIEENRESFKEIIEKAVKDDLQRGTIFSARRAIEQEMKQLLADLVNEVRIDTKKALVDYFTVKKNDPES